MSLSENVRSIIGDPSAVCSSILENKYTVAVMFVLLVFYAGKIAPELSEYAARMFESTILRVILLTAIFHVGSKSPSIAALGAVGLVISLQTLDKYNVARAIALLYNTGDADAGDGGGMGHQTVPESYTANYDDSHKVRDNQSGVVGNGAHVDKLALV